MNDYEIMFSLNKLAGNITNYANACLKPYGLTYSQLSVLLFLWQHQDETINQKNICQELEISHATAVGIIARMHGRGLIEVAISSTDRRNTNIYLTPHGIALIKETKGFQDDLVRRFKQGLHQDEMESFLMKIRKINRSFKL